MSSCDSTRISRYLGPILSCFVSLPVVQAAEPRPPRPNPYKPVDYIEWINRTIGGDIQENAADVYRQAACKVTRLKVSEHGKTTHAQWKAAWAPTLVGPWNNNDHPRVAGWLVRHGRAMDLFRRATEIQGCFFRIEREQIYDNPRINDGLVNRRFSNVLEYDELARGLIAEGFNQWNSDDPGRLLPNVTVVLKSAHHFARGPTTTERRCGGRNAILAYAAIRHALRHSRDPGAFAMEALAALKSADPPWPALKPIYDLAKVFDWDFCQRLWQPNENGELFMSERDLRTFADFSSDEEAQALRALGYYSMLRELDAQHAEFEAWLRKPYYAAAADRARFDRKRQVNSPQSNLLLWIIHCDIDGRLEDERAATLQRGTHLLLRIFEHHRQTGSFPDSLDMLSSPDLRRLRFDAYSGRDLVYRREGDTFTLYTVSENLKDDGGRHSEDWAEGDHVFWPVIEPAAEKK